MNYGLPYMGSKNRIIKKLSKYFPKNIDNFYDLFAGGCAVSDYFLREKTYKKYTINDINPTPITLYKNALGGGYTNETRWISRDDFNKLKDIDPYVKYVWSFGNKGTNYLYSKGIEPYKKACHCAIVFDNWTLLKELCPEIWECAYEEIKNIKDTKQRRLKFGRKIVKRLKEIGNWELIQNNPLYKSCHWRHNGLANKNTDLESLQSLERLERLQSLERLEEQQNITFTTKNYCEIKIKNNSLVYCDIPYKDMAGYNIQFDYEKFYNWCSMQKELVIISEYSMPNDKFICIAEESLNNSLSTNGSTKGG